jgi:2-polyprenyl-3-methyl-5-hydroxy-6-metoxy-1,4-benzoquinol methylase
LLDFGCAAGYFLKLARNDGWEISGIELSESMVTLVAQTLHVPIVRTIEELPHHDFDAITLWEVIEHLPRPLAELQRLYASLNPGGVIMLSTPNTKHWQVAQEPDQWEGFRPPSHVLFFTAQTIREMLTRAGFTSISIEKGSLLPMLPRWLHNVSVPLQAGLATGQARFWRTSLYTWRAVRALGYLWDRIAHPGLDVFATLEITALKPDE